jgi:PPP family 3-phenylpropionic acid transporter
MYATWFTIGIFALYLQLYAFYIIGVSNLVVGLLATVYFSVNAPASIFSGYLVDKYGIAKTLLVLSLVLMSITSFITPLYKDGLYLLFIRALQGLTTAAIIPIGNLLAAKFMGTGKGIGTINMVGSMGFASAGIFGGLLAEFISYSQLFQLCGLITLVPILLIMNIKEGGYDLQESKISLRELIYLPRPIWVIYTVYSFRFLAAGGIWSLFSLFLYSLGANDFLVGVAFSLNTVTQVTLFRYAGILSEGRGFKVFNLGVLLTIIVFIGYYFSPNIYYVLPLQVLLGVSWVSIYSGANVFIIENAPREYQGTALGALNMFNALSWVIGSVLNGYISDIAGNYKTYIFIGIIITFLAYVFSELYYRLRYRE